jgi:hypothetical protein
LRTSSFAVTITAAIPPNTTSNPNIKVKILRIMTKTLMPLTQPKVKVTDLLNALMTP